MSVPAAALLALFMADAPAEKAPAPIIRMSVIKADPGNKELTAQIEAALMAVAGECLGHNNDGAPAVKMRAAGTTGQRGAGATVEWFELGKAREDDAAKCFREKAALIPIPVGTTVYVNQSVTAIPTSDDVKPTKLPMDDKDAERRLKDVREKVLTCNAKGAPPAGGKKKGSVGATLVIGKNGNARSVEITGSELMWPDAERCVADTLADFKYDEDKDGRAIELSPRFEFDVEKK